MVLSQIDALNAAAAQTIARKALKRDASTLGDRYEDLVMFLVEQGSGHDGRILLAGDADNVRLINGGESAGSPRARMREATLNR